MNWIPLTSEEQLTAIISKSYSAPQLIYKHSTRCATSSVALSRLERAASPAAQVDFYFLDLIAHRALSHKIAADFNVYHESPQVLLIKNGECVYDESHMGISMNEIAEHVESSGV